jgi:hypothetical protein
MSKTEIEFTVHDDEATAEAAASAFFWRMFRIRHVRWLVTSAALWSAAILLTVRHLRNSWEMGVFVFFLCSTVMYVPIFHFARRKAASLVVRRSPERRVRVTPTDITISSGLASTTLPWARFQSIWEFPDFTILATGTNFYWWLPREAVPADAMAIIREAANAQAD